MNFTLEVWPAKWINAEHIEFWHHSLACNPLLQGPFFRPEFFECLVKSRKRCFLTVFRNNREIVALLPFELGKRNIAYPIANEIIGYYGMIAPENNFPGWNLQEIIKRIGLSGFVFDQVPLGQTLFAPHTKKIEYSPALMLKSTHHETVEYWKKSGQNTFDRLDYKTRKLGKKGRLRFEFSSQCPRLFHFFMKQKQIQYMRTGANNDLGIRENLMLLRTVSEQKTSSLRLILSGIYLNDEPVAAHVGLASEKVMYSWFPAMKHMGENQSPGLALYSHLIPRMHEEGYEMLDFGTMPLQIKTRLMNASYPIRRGFVRV